MKVILISKFANLGNVGDVINVKDGYGKNFLIPQKKAIFYSNTNYKLFEVKKEQFEVENQENISVAQKNKEKIDGKTITMIENASDDGKLYGSITTTVLTAPVNVAVLLLKSQILKASSLCGIVTLKPEKFTSIRDCTDLLRSPFGTCIGI